MKSQHFLPQLLTSTSALGKVTRVFQHLVVRQVELIEQEQIRERVGRQGDQQVFIQQQTHSVVREADGNLRTETPEQVKEAEYQFNVSVFTTDRKQFSLTWHRSCRVTCTWL